MAFRVTSWDGARGAGRIEGDVGAFEVARAHLRVDDLVVGEDVDAVFEEDEAGRVVARDVVPVRWRENALPINEADGDAALPPELAATIKDASAVFSKHTRLVTMGAEEDRARLEVHDVDWPPPITPPLATFAFDGVAYLKLRPFSDDVARVSAVPWPVFRRARPRVLAYWSLAAEDVPDECFVFRFEPARFTQSAGYVVAAALAFTRKAKR